eukprot:TRINITY_DN3151_c0_g2_i2.p1 TRINITY_DN3151_c0_g2~~TRINITY_DN3151_c0_g2_i2.p1  ORF type:complete len:297 (+),score=44.10 TRINITY_DN3151_c0_g2_i2:66-956(+)
MRRGVKIAVNVFQSLKPKAVDTESTPLLVLHDFFESSTNWKRLAKKLTNACANDVWTLDLRNHGKSEHADEMEVEDLMADIEKIQQENKLPSLSLLGHGLLGGTVAMRYALERPQIIDRLVVYDYLHNYQPALNLQTSIDSMLNSLSFTPQVEKQEPGIIISPKSQIEPQINKDLMDVTWTAFLMQNLKVVDQKPVWSKVNLSAIQKHSSYYTNRTLLQTPKPQLINNKECLFLSSKEITDENELRQNQEKLKALFPKSVFKTIEGDYWSMYMNDKALIQEVGIYFRRNYRAVILQ